MSQLVRNYPAPAAPGATPAAPRGRTGIGIIHRLALMLVWLAVAMGALVFAEPAPVDLLMAILIVLLPVIGLAPVKPSLLLYFSFWLIVTAAGFFASAQGLIYTKPAIHTIITLFLALGAFILANFIASRPKAHARLILNAQLAAACLAALVGVIGYLDLIPGTYDLFTKFGRATGPFKDPNVFGPFVGFAALYALHLCLASSRRNWVPAFLMLGFLILGLFLSFSRGAWMSFAVSVLVFGYLQFVTATDIGERLKLVSLAFLAAVAVAFALFTAMQFEKTSSLLQERASLSQNYDTGPDGRFDGHWKAGRLLLDHPLGLGAGEFQSSYHHEDVHNVYLSMFLNAGWLGGWVYLIAVGIPLVIGLRHAFVRVETQAMFHVVYAAYVGTVGEGIIVDTDHWRHFYLLLALVMGLWAASRRRGAQESGWASAASGTAIPAERYRLARVSLPAANLAPNAPAPGYRRAPACRTRPRRHRFEATAVPYPNGMTTRDAGDGTIWVISQWRPV